jgi:hypothetical protein
MFSFLFGRLYDALLGSVPAAVVFDRSRCSGSVRVSGSLPCQPGWFSVRGLSLRLRLAVWSDLACDWFSQGLWAWHPRRLWVTVVLPFFTALRG